MTADICAVCWNRETSSPPVIGAAGGSAAVEDSRSESGDTRRSEPKNEPASPPGVLSLLPTDLPLRRAPSSGVLGSDDQSDSSSESATNARVVSPSDQRPHDQRHQPYNMTYYGGPHGTAPTSQMLHQHRHQQQQQLMLQRHHHLQSTHHLRSDNLTAYASVTDDDSTAVEAELYCSSARDQYYGHSSPVMQYYAQNAAPAAVKCLDDLDRV